MRVFFNFIAAEFPKVPSPNPARIPPQTPPAGGKSAEAGQFHSPRKIVCPAESELVFRIFVKKCSNFVQKTPPLICTQISTGFESRSEVAKSQSDRQRARRGRGNFCGAKIICDQIPPPPLKWALKSRHRNHVSAVFF